MTAPVRHPEAPVVVAVCGLGMVACVALAFLFGQFRIYAPMARELLLATVTPQFAAGMVFGWLCIAAIALCIAWKRP